MLVLNKTKNKKVACLCFSDIFAVCCCPVPTYYTYILSVDICLCLVLTFYTGGQIDFLYEAKNSVYCQQSSTLYKKKKQKTK